MNKIQELAQLLEAENASLMKVVGEEKLANMKKADQLSKKQKELEALEEQLVTRSKSLDDREKETELRWNQIRKASKSIIAKVKRQVVWNNSLKFLATSQNRIIKICNDSKSMGNRRKRLCF